MQSPATTILIICTSGQRLRVEAAEIAAYRTTRQAAADSGTSAAEHQAETALAMADDDEVFEWLLRMMGSRLLTAAELRRIDALASEIDSLLDASWVAMTLPTCGQHAVGVAAVAERARRSAAAASNEGSSLLKFG